jgi:hypothetical protein
VLAEVVVVVQMAQFLVEQVVQEEEVLEVTLQAETVQWEQQELLILAVVVEVVVVGLQVLQVQLEVQV